MRDAIEMARESHLDVYGLGKSHAKFVEALEHFSAIARAAEREACAKVADRYVGADPIAAAIRARELT
jgi:hypothetical protein